jgi:hypothetical protein
MTMFTLAFWHLTLVRAVKTFAQALAALLGANAVDLVHANWFVTLSTAGLAGLMSVLTSVSTISTDAPQLNAATSGPKAGPLSDGRNPLDTV